MTEIVKIGTAEMRLQDCMDYMRGLPDKAFDLAIVDPPYGIDEKFRGGKSGKMNFNNVVNKGWDKKPSANYFIELQRVSADQIIWGGNYFLDCLSSTRCVIVWDKLIPQNFSLAGFELAWTSFDSLAKVIRLTNTNGGKIHPTQKPIKLYEWLLTNYAKPGQRILDTHLGSMSSVIACLNMGFEIVGCELDADYFKAGVERVMDSQKQQRLELEVTA